MLKKTFVKTSIIAFIFLSFPVGILSAQQQSENFSGNNPDSYTCYDRQGNLVTDSSGNSLDPIKDEVSGVFYCNVNPAAGYQPCEDGIYDQGEICDPRAVLNPPTLQQLEVWFVRIVYAIWAVAGTFSFIGIVIIGYQYMISRGAPEATVKVKDRISKFIIGFCLVFLAVPILNTVFRLLQVNDSVQCYQGLTSNVGIGFQFFFPELCTAPNLTGAVTAGDVCTEVERLLNNGQLTVGDIVQSRSTGLACSSINQSTPACGLPGIITVSFTCDQSSKTWVPDLQILNR